MYTCNLHRNPRQQNYMCRILTSITARPQLYERNAEY